MALQSSGTISLNDVHLELGAASGSTISMNDADVRALAKVPSGSYGMNSFYGKSASKDTRITSVGRAFNANGPYKYGWAASSKSNYYHDENSTTAQSFGSISATTGLITSGTLHTIQVAKYYNTDDHLEIASSRSSNGGWTSVTIYSSANTANKYTFNRTNAFTFQALNAGTSNPSISGSYRWIFSDGGGGYHSPSDSNVETVHNLFVDAWTHGRTIYCDFN
jgi:hypothetical protein